MRMSMVLDQTAFAALGGVKKNSQIDYESGKTAPKVDYLLALEQHGIDICFILSGRQYDSAMPLEQHQLLDMFERLSSREREAVMTMMSVLTGQTIGLAEISSKSKSGSASIHYLQQGMQQFSHEPPAPEEPGK